MGAGKSICLLTRKNIKTNSKRVKERDKEKESMNKITLKRNMASPHVLYWLEGRNHNAEK